MADRIDFLAGIDGVIFDLDGTLADSMWIWRDIDLNYLGRRGIEMPEGLQKELTGLSLHENAVYFKTRFSLPDSLEEILDEWNRMAYAYYESIIPMKEGAMSLLQFLQKKQIPMAVATSNSFELTDAFLSHWALYPFFKCVLTSREIPQGKTSTRIYFEAAEQLGSVPQRTLVFEDTLISVQTALSAGMKVLAVEDADSADEREALRQTADGYLVSLEELLS